jgi:hypothetical protein
MPAAAPCSRRARDDSSARQAARTASRGGIGNVAVPEPATVGYHDRHGPVIRPGCRSCGVLRPNAAVPCSARQSGTINPGDRLRTVRVRGGELVPLVRLVPRAGITFADVLAVQFDCGAGAYRRSMRRQGGGHACHRPRRFRDLPSTSPRPGAGAWRRSPCPVSCWVPSGAGAPRARAHPIGGSR